MDPDENLREQRELVTGFNVHFDAADARDVDFASDEHDVRRLVELVEALDGWLSKGGYLPAAWQRKRHLHGYTASGEQVTVSETGA